jgi:hypothetical protein
VWDCLKPVQLGPAGPNVIVTFLFGSVIKLAKSAIKHCMQCKSCYLYPLDNCITTAVRSRFSGLICMPNFATSVHSHDYLGVIGGKIWLPFHLGNLTMLFNSEIMTKVYSCWALFAVLVGSRPFENCFDIAFITAERSGWRWNNHLDHFILLRVMYSFISFS